MTVALTSPGAAQVGGWLDNSCEAAARGLWLYARFLLSNSVSSGSTGSGGCQRDACEHCRVNGLDSESIFRGDVLF